MNQLNSKIECIDLSTLIIGIDIAKYTHMARAVDYRGVELSKVISFENSEEGFTQFFNWVNQIMINNNKSKCLIGMEPTGHYWFNIGDYIKKQSKKYKLVLVNPHHVKKSKELDDNTPTKHDKKDALTIAKLIKDGRYIIPNIPEGVFAELRNVINMRERFVKEIGRVNSKLNRWVDIYFPEYKQVFKDITCPTSLLTLKYMTLPNDIVGLDEEQIVEIWRIKFKTGIGIKKARVLKAAALHSVGRNFGLNSARDEINWLIEDCEMLVTRLEALQKRIVQLLNKIPYSDKLVSICGLGEVTVACILSETGDLRNYANGKQLQKLAGLNLKENSSGLHKGQTTISKRGRKGLRSFLYRCILPLVCKNSEFKELHKYYTTRRDNPLKKMQSLIALCCKVLRVLHGIAINNSDYDSKEVLKGIDFSTIKQVAA